MGDRPEPRMDANQRECSQSPREFVVRVETSGRLCRTEFIPFIGRLG